MSTWNQNYIIPNALFRLFSVNSRFVKPCLGVCPFSLIIVHLYLAVRGDMLLYLSCNRIQPLGVFETIDFRFFLPLSPTSPTLYLSLCNSIIPRSRIAFFLLQHSQSTHWDAALVQMIQCFGAEPCWLEQDFISELLAVRKIDIHVGFISRKRKRLGSVITWTS